MNSDRSNPPKFGVWLLQLLDDRDALTGDLVERFREGQTRGWFWKQALVAIGVHVMTDVHRHWPHFCYAIAGTAMRFFFMGALLPRWLHWWNLPFPWSLLVSELSRPALLALAALPVLAFGLILSQAFHLRFLIRTAAINLSLITVGHFLPDLCPWLLRTDPNYPHFRTFIFPHIVIPVMLFLNFLASAWLACPLPRRTPPIGEAKTSAP